MKDFIFDKADSEGGDNNVEVTYWSLLPSITPHTKAGFTFQEYYIRHTKYYNNRSLVDGNMQTSHENGILTARQYFYQKLLE